MNLLQAKRLHELIVDRPFDWINKAPGGHWTTVHDRPLRPVDLLAGDPTGPRPGDGQTRWLAIDIDASGRYHPERNLQAIPALLQLLAVHGLEGVLIVQSSDSRGIHLWIPVQLQPTQRLAEWLEDLITSAGFRIEPGHLELFPNCPRNRSALPQGIRLPLVAAGSWVLDSELNPVHQSVDRFCDAWEAALAINDGFSLATDLDANPEASGYWKKIPDAQFRLEQGFTGRGQTDELASAAAYLGRWEGLSGVALQRRMCALLLAAPGCKEHSGHYREIAAGTLDKWWRHYSSRDAHRCGPTAGRSQPRSQHSTHNADLAAGRAQAIAAAVGQLRQAGLAFNTLTEAREAVAELVKQQSGSKPGHATLKKQDQLLSTLLETALVSVY